MGFSRQEYWSGLPLPSPSVFLKGKSDDAIFNYLKTARGSPLHLTRSPNSLPVTQKSLHDLAPGHLTNLISHHFLPHSVCPIHTPRTPFSSDHSPTGGLQTPHPLGLLQPHGPLLNLVHACVSSVRDLHVRGPHPSTRPGPSSLCAPGGSHPCP